MATLWAFLAYLIGSDYIKLDTPPPKEYNPKTIERIITCPSVSTKSLEQRIVVMTKELATQKQAMSVIIKSQTDILEYLKYQTDLGD